MSDLTDKLKKKLEGAGLNKAEIKAIMESVPSLRKKLKKGETKRGIGPAGGAPVSKKTGKVFQKVYKPNNSTHLLDVTVMNKVGQGEPPRYNIRYIGHSILGLNPFGR